MTEEKLIPRFKNGKLIFERMNCDKVFQIYYENFFLRNKFNKTIILF